MSGKRNRFVGMASFTEKDKDIFFGRTQDIERLTTLIQLERLVVLFSKSGMGKSSLLKAGIEPRLVEKGYEPYRIRFFNYNKEQDETEYTSPTQILENALPAWEEGTFLDAIVEPKYRNAAWARLKCYHARYPEKTQLLLMDQFEELFTHPAEEVTWFKYQLGDILESQLPQSIKRRLADFPNLTPEQLNLLYAPIPLRTVLSLRADYISFLQQLKDTIPFILNKTYELAPLNRELAKEALLMPAEMEGELFSTPPFEIAEDAQNAIIQQLEDTHKQVESFQLQTIGSEIERIITEKRKTNPEVSEVVAADLPKLADIWAQFYDRTIASLPDAHRAAACELLEGSLVQEGRRITLDEVVCKKVLADEATLKMLVESRLLNKIKNNTSGDSYEVSHDTLIQPITAQREKRQAERKEAEMQQQLAIAEANAAKERIATAQKAREAHRNQMMFRMAGGGFVLAMVAVVFSVYFYWKAVENAGKARKEKEKAEKLVKAFYFYEDKFALAFRDSFYFIDKKGDEIRKLQRWKRAEQFNERGFAKVRDETQEYLLDTLGIKYPLADKLEELNSQTIALDLGEYELKEIPKEVFQHTQLKILLLHNNALKTLPAEIGKLSNLERLYLGNNQIHALPAEIGKLTKLYYLHCHDNELSALPAEIGKLKNLQYLFCENNPLSKVEKGKIKKLLPQCKISF